ncbi:hypothetical protein B0H14DRAFT_3775469 [Mycena olivaceomarginata]|nr:hypothetical protein B0H14DRAFT_3775469 [Mycena olivaceomarginata]
MYTFCHIRGLREVWGYLWTSWYTPNMWKLWARSTSPLLSRLRTTMNVENFWKQLKHGFLHNHVRPRLDQLIWILITQVTPAYLARANTLNDGHRLGRSKALTPFQKTFKSEWIRLESVTTREDADEKYITRVDRWTCTCKAQAMHSCHLCKHLVQSLPHPPAKFWMEVVRRRTLPLYHHPALVIPGSQWIEPADGSITDGDDHAFRTRSNVLAGGGGWRELDFSTPSLLGKRARPVIPEVDGSSSDDAAEVQRMFFPSFNGEHSDNEEEVNFNFSFQIDGYSAHLLKRAEEFERAAAIFRAQVPHRNRIWMSSMVKQDVGRDVGNLVKDIHRYESSSRVRDTTWARKKGDKEEQRRIKNTMGYQ